MKRAMRRKTILPILILASFLGICGSASAAPKTLGCTGSSGNIFNLEPRANAVVQVAQSVALLPGAGNGGDDLVVGTATDARGLDTNPNATIISQDAFYVQRSNSNCAADVEGGVPLISNTFDPEFVGFGNLVAVGDPVRNQFFLVDLRFGVFTDDNGVGILRTDAPTLLNTTGCPSGTEVDTAGCFTSAAVTNITTLNAFLFNPHLAVDQRTSGTGAGDVYAVVTQRDLSNTLHTHVFISACTNALNCGNSVQISPSNDVEADYAWVQVRPDGSITITYRNTTFPGIHPEEIRFVNCTPNGAPNPPTCSAPLAVTTEPHPIFASFIGNMVQGDVLYPKHVHRLEADGHTVTTFVVYDRCDVALFGLINEACPKASVVVTSSNNEGASWTPIAKVSSSAGHQFFGAPATDASTGTINIGYYSTENDPSHLLAQVFVAQIDAGMTSVSSTHLLTTDFADTQATSPLSFLLQPNGFGDAIGVAAAGTGQSGKSRAYVSFTWNTVNGIYNGVSSADVNNHLAEFQY